MWSKNKVNFFYYFYQLPVHDRFDKERKTTIGKKSSSSRFLRIQCRLLFAMVNQFVNKLQREGFTARHFETSGGGGILNNIFPRP